MKAPVLTFAVVFALPSLAVQTLAADRLYRLVPDSTAEVTYCLGPCGCPIGTLSGPLHGVFTLELDHSDPLFDHYRVSSVRLTVELFAFRNVEFTGDGLYVIGGEVELTQRLTLQLRSTESAEPYHFDTGFVAVDPAHPFPEIAIGALSDLNVCTQVQLNLITQPVDCPGDLTGDNEVGIADLAILLPNFGVPSGASLGDGDFDDDADVDLADLSLLLSAFGAVCP
jgi:hypothetical protein